MSEPPVESAPDGTFRGKVLRAGAWSLAIQGADRVLGLVRTVLLARLLSPRDIGLFAVAAMALNLLETFSRTGFFSALIFRQEVDRRDLDVAWSVHAIRGIARASLFWLAAPFIAGFYDSPEVSALVRLIAILLAIQGFNNIGTVYFRKELRYHKQFLMEFGGRAADLITVVAFGLMLRNVWALVFGLAARYMVQFGLSYRLHPFRPRPCLSLAALKPLVGFGMWVSLTGIVIFIGRQSAGLVLGKVISVKALGLYQMAFMIAQATILDPVLAITGVAFPALSMLQEAPERFRQSCLASIGLSAMVVMPLCTLVALAAEDIAGILLGPAWVPIVPALRVLCVAFLAISLSTLTEPIFMAGGRPRNVFRTQLCRAAFVVITAYPLALWAGTTGAALSVLCGGVGMLGVSFFLARRAVAFKPSEVSGILVPPAIGCMALTAVWTLVSTGTISSGASGLGPSVVVLGLKLGAGVAAFAAGYQLSQGLNPTGIDFNFLRALVRRGRQL